VPASGPVVAVGLLLAGVTTALARHTDEPDDNLGSRLLVTRECSRTVAEIDYLDM
jgi:hypothetical protein